MIPIYKPYLPKSSLKYAHEALDSGWLSSQGKYLPMVTERLQELLGVKYALPVFNGTVACHLVAKALNRKIGREKHKILCPDNVYVAAINSFLFDKGSFELITVKSDLDTWNIDLEDLDKKINLYPDASCLIVHNMGNIINIPELKRKYPNTTFIEDACEALFGKHENTYAGTQSFCSSFSFFANKTLTAGEFGAFVTNDEDTYEYIKCIHSQGQSSARFIHNELGYNYRSTNIQNAIFMGQLEIADQIIEMKQDIFDKYRTAFRDRNDILIQNEMKDTRHANWMFGIRIKNNTDFDVANYFFAARSIEIRPMFYALSEHGHFKNNENITIDDTTNAKLLNEQIIVLPSFPELGKSEQQYIITIVEEYLKII